MSASPRESHRLAPPTTCCCHGDARCNDHFCARCGTDYPATPAPLDVDAPDNANAATTSANATPAPLDVMVAALVDPEPPHTCPSCGHDGLPPLASLAPLEVTSK